MKELFDYAEKLVPGSLAARFAEAQEFIEESGLASRTGTADPANRAGRAPLSNIVVIPPFRTEAVFSGNRDRPGANLLPEAAGGFLGLASALRTEAERGAKICSVCAGAFYLCAAGIADGKPATTHWSLAEALAQAFPQVRVEAERMLIDNGTFITAGGLTA